MNAQQKVLLQKISTDRQWSLVRVKNNLGMTKLEILGNLCLDLGYGKIAVQPRKELSSFTRFMKEFAHAAYFENSKKSTKKLYLLFSSNFFAVGSHFENSMLVNSPHAGEYDGPHIDYFGPMFHKGFRQYDIVTGDHGKTDMDIWKLLQDPTCAFWDAVSRTPEQLRT